MKCKALLAAVAIAAVSVSSAFAGGIGSGPIGVRIKNVGSQAVGVAALSGSPSDASLNSKAVTVGSRGIVQFNVNKGAFGAIAKNPNNSAVKKVRSFDTKEVKTVYLQAEQNGTVATLQGAPAGVKF